MRILVTGGAGFIGSHVVDKVADAGHEPVIFDRIVSPWHDPAQVPTIIGELDDLAALERAVEDCDAVMHLAAAADVNEVAAAPLPAEACNARGTLHVLEAARRAGVRRVVYASTIWVYTGESGQVVDEDSDLGMPNHLYTASKLAGEMYCRSYHELYDLDYTILRFGIPYGPRARPAAVVPAFVGKALAGEPLTIAGDGSASRRFVYVEDLADGCVAALDPRASGRIYNLVSDESVTVREIAELVQELVAPVEIVHTEGRRADYVGVEVSGQRAATELGWTPQTPFREGVRRYAESRRAALVPPPAPAVRQTERPGALRRVLVPLAYTLGAMAVMLAYLAAVRDVGLSAAEARTIATVAIVSVGLYLLIELQWGRREERGRGRFLLTIVVGLAVGLALLAEFPWTRDMTGLAEPTAGVIVLSLTGAALGIGLAALGLSLVRARPGFEAHESRA